MISSLLLLRSLLLLFRDRSHWPPPCWPLLLCTNRSRCWVSVFLSCIPPAFHQTHGAKFAALPLLKCTSVMFFPAQVSVSFPSSRTCTWALQERLQACCLRSTTQSFCTCWSRQSRSARRWALQVWGDAFVLTWRKCMTWPACICATLFCPMWPQTCTINSCLLAQDQSFNSNWMDLIPGGWGSCRASGPPGQGSRPEVCD